VWRTDRQTSCYGIVRAMHTRRAVKIGSVVLLFFAALAIGMIGLLTCIHKQRLWFQFYINVQDKINSLKLFCYTFDMGQSDPSTGWVVSGWQWEYPIGRPIFCKFSAALVKTKRFNILVFSDWCPETLRGLYRSAKQESCTGCEFAALNTEESRQGNFVFDGK